VSNCSDLPIGERYVKVTTPPLSPPRCECAPTFTFNGFYCISCPPRVKDCTYDPVEGTFDILSCTDTDLYEEY